MSIVEDEAVLARLLATDGLDDVRADVISGLSSGVRETIGNAIKVIATLGDRTIEPQLRHILESNDDYVLRRIAALGARDLRLDSLFYIIAHRAIHPADATEAQDLTYAAFDLASAEDLLMFGLRAARRGGEAMRILGHLLQGQLRPIDELKVLRTWAMHAAEPLPSERERLLVILPALAGDSETAESVVFVAGAWRIQSEEMQDLVRRNPEAAARAVLELDESNSAHVFELQWILEEVPLEVLRDAGVSAEILETKKRLDEWRRRREQNRDLEAILQITEEDLFRRAVVANAGFINQHVRELTPDARERISVVVHGAWPPKGVRASVERRESEIHFANGEAFAWLTLGPALDVVPTPDQWAELATCGAVMTDTAEWLRHHYTPAAARSAAESLTSNLPRPWAQLITACLLMFDCPTRSLPLL